MIPQVFAHEGEATSSEIMNTNMMGDMMNFHWGSWSAVFIILWWITWILVITALIVAIRWLWIKGGKDK
jgi:hypothetical protein